MPQLVPFFLIILIGIAVAIPELVPFFFKISVMVILIALIYYSFFYIIRYIKYELRNPSNDGPSTRAYKYKKSTHRRSYFNRGQKKIR